MAFSLVVAPTVGFIHVIKKSDHVVTNFYDRVMSESLLSGNVYRSLLRFAFSSKINPRYVTEKNYRWWIRFWTLKNLQQLCCRLWLSAPRDVCDVITWSLFWITWIKPRVREAAWKKSHLNRGLGSILNSVGLGSRDHASRLPVMFSFTCTKRTFHPVFLSFV